MISTHRCRVLTALVVALSLPAAAATTWAEPATKSQQVTNESAPAWQSKLDSALKAAVDVSPDLSMRVVIRTSAAAREGTARRLAVVGFLVHQISAAGVLLTATPREVVVLAEDPIIDEIDLAAPLTDAP